MFEALASEERINILKLLDQNKQMTGTDVANVLTISKSSAFKQLNRLARAGLVERMDEGRKWIYYRNTSKAERLLHPEDVTITLVLSSAMAALVAGLILLMAIQPILGPGASSSSLSGGTDPSVLILGHPSAGAGGLVVQVYAGSADLQDLSVFVSTDADGTVVATANTADAAPTLMLMGYGSSARSAGPSVTIHDLNGNGELDAGDTISVSGLAAGCTLWVASGGAAVASAPLSA